MSEKNADSVCGICTLQLPEALSDEKELAAEIKRTQVLLQARKRTALTSPVVGGRTVGEPGKRARRQVDAEK